MTYTDSIHLVSDSVEELHTFAQSIGLKREWFQDHPSHPHYDLMGSMLGRAMAAGARGVTSREVVEICKRNYES